VNDILHNKASALLHLETGPGLGCTEPAAIGLSAAAAASLFKDRNFDAIEVTTDPNIYKNAMGVIIPGSGGECGIPLASAMGAAAGDPGLKLQVFAKMDPQRLAMAKRLIREGKVSAGMTKDQPGLYVRTVIRGAGHRAEAVITGQHDHIAFLSWDGKPQYGHPLLGAAAKEDGNLAELEAWLLSLSLTDMVAQLDSLNEADLSYIREGIAMNSKLVEYGMAQAPGLGVAMAQNRLIQQGFLAKDMATWAGVMTAAGVDSRMGGAMLPAMTLAGSGNQGITSGIPIWTVAEFTGNRDRRLVCRAVALSYLVTCTIKAHAGRLSALCGSGVAGGAGVAAGVAYLRGGKTDHIGGAIKNHLETFATVICDGAKTSCALKLGEAATAAVKNALLSLQGTVVKYQDGFIDKSPEKTMLNLGRLSREGLSRMDPVILDIMLNKGA
jgi:L-cysteine desulfidase